MTIALLFTSMLTAHSAQTGAAETDSAHPPIAYKLLTRAEKETFVAHGRFEGSEQDAADGYIHLSTDSQLARTADRHFAGNTDLFLAAVDVKAAGDALKWERSPRSGLVFPHLYGVLEQRLVRSLVPFRRDEHGRVVLDATP